MARQTFRDTNCPETEHTIRLDGVTLKFGRDGSLKDPRPDQVAAMTADPYRQQRFVEGSRSPVRQGAAAVKPAGEVGTSPASPAGASASAEAKEEGE